MSDPFIPFIETLVGKASEQLASVNMPQDIMGENLAIIEQFDNIALTQIIRPEPGITVPGSEHYIPWDDATIPQALTLFTEAMIFAMIRAYQRGYPSNVKGELLQRFAMPVFSHVQQVVGATYGQEKTPDFQLSMAQQADMIQHAAEACFLSAISEYENENGPIPTSPPGNMPGTAPPDYLSDTAPSAPEPSPSTAPPSSRQKSEQKPEKHSKKSPPGNPQGTSRAARPLPQGPSPHDKYAAVAIFLKNLPENRQQKIIHAFSKAERELIAYYSNPKHIEQSLDLNCVQAQLVQFKSFLSKSHGKESGQPSNGQAGLRNLIKGVSKHQLLALVKEERPAIRSYLQNLYRQQPEGKTIQWLNPDKAETDLSPAIEQVLFQYLQRRLREKETV